MLLPLLPAVRGDLGVDLSHGQLVSTLAFGFRLNLFEPIGSGCDGIDEILDAHDDDRGLAPPINNEPLVFFRGSLHDLAELCARRQGGNNVAHTFGANG